MALDVVYVVGPSSENEELRYSLRSIHELFPHRMVWIVGHAPKWVRNVGHIFRMQTKTKFENSTENLLAACAHPDVSDDFVYMNDDFFVVRKRSTIPALHQGNIPKDLPVWKGAERLRQAAYRVGLAGTVEIMKRWGLEDLKTYELHVPMEINGPKMADVIARARAEMNVTALHKRSLYGNVYQIGGEKVDDPKVAGHTLNKGIPKGTPFVSTSNNSFHSGLVGRELRAMFPDPSPYEEA